MKRHLFRFLKDPLCHLVLIGAVAYSLAQPQQVTDSSHEIRVSQEFVDQIEKQFHHTYFRQPTPEEKKQLIDNAIMDLALYREGLQYNLDEADEVVKRRVIQKMNFIIEGMAKPGTPSLSDLASFLDENPDQFILPEQYSFEHRFINGHSEASHMKARALMAQLQSADIDESDARGEYFLRGQRFNSMESARINGIFGRSFAKHLQNQAGNQWLGPYPSTYGLHVVRIKEVVPARSPELADVKDQVYAAWKKAETEANITAIKQNLLEQYQVSIATDKSGEIASKEQQGEQHVALNQI